MEMTRQEITQVRNTVARLERLIPWIEAQRKHHETVALLYEHEASRMSEELMVMRMVTGMEDLSASMDNITASVQGMVARQFTGFDDIGT